MSKLDPKHFAPDWLLNYQAKHKQSPTQAEQRFNKILGAVCSEINYAYTFQGLLFDIQNDKYYISDFYIPDHKVIFEIDGSSHDQKKEHDRKRDLFCNRVGILVVRISNKTTNDPDRCKRVIWNSLRRSSLKTLQRREFDKWFDEEISGRLARKQPQMRNRTPISPLGAG